MTYDGYTAVAAVVFDYGGVLTTPVRDSIAAWLEQDEIDPRSFSRTLKAWLSRSAPNGTPIHRLETGELSTDEFEALFAAELVRLDGSPVPAGGLLSALFAQMRPDPEMFELAQDIKECDVKVALLSNSWGNTYPRQDIDALFDAVVISGEVGMRKPNPDIFRHALGLLGVEPETAMFVDDAEPNLEGAARVALRPVHHIGAAQTRAALASVIRGLVPYPRRRKDKTA